MPIFTTIDENATHAFEATMFRNVPFTTRALYDPTHNTSHHAHTTRVRKHDASSQRANCMRLEEACTHYNTLHLPWMSARVRPVPHRRSTHPT